MGLIVGRAPLRLPLAGGLSDMREFLEEDPGRTVSVALSLYVYAQIKPNPVGTSSLHLNRESFRAASLSAIPNPLLQSVLTVLDADPVATDIYLMSDMPGSSGLGGSGAATVALVAALSRHLSRDESPDAVLRASAEAEVLVAGNGGFHDTAIATLGGLRHISYGAEGVITSRELPGTAAHALLSRSRVRLLPTSGSTAASLVDLRSRLPEIRPILREMAAVADELATALDADASPGEEVIRLIRHNQQLKAGVLGAEYLDASRAASADLDSATTVAILPGGKLGSTLWLLRVATEGAPREDRGPEWSKLATEAAGGVAVGTFA